MIQEFKKFAIQGSLIDIAVGLVMGAAFATVTGAFVDGVFMPMMGQLFQIGDMAQAKWVLAPAIYAPDGKIETAESAVHYGKFMSTLINFIIIAFVMFWIVRIVNRFKHDQPAAPATPSQEQLLTEIRDLLSKK
ncbi:MAG: large conductance mechanosensitive channel protein MscL [Saprospiraceae bacterium]|nr:large conductance mechanosensitive channel protein MscL [Saprospiraceae bacterium]